MDVTNRRWQLKLRTLFLFTFLVALNLVGVVAGEIKVLANTLGITWVILAILGYRVAAVVVLLLWVLALIGLVT